VGLLDFDKLVEVFGVIQGRELGNKNILDIIAKGGNDQGSLPAPQGLM
jgi:hypothetical protein